SPIMAKKKSSPSAKAARGSDAPAVSSLRRQIDALDRQLVELLNRRGTLSQELGQIKQNGDQPIYAPGREQEVLARVVALSEGPLSAESVRSIFREVVSGCRAIERPL